MACVSISDMCFVEFSFFMHHLSQLFDGNQILLYGSSLLLNVKKKVCVCVWIRNVTKTCSVENPNRIYRESLEFQRLNENAPRYPRTRYLKKVSF